jgi:hypothetical protein
MIFLKIRAYIFGGEFFDGFFSRMHSKMIKTTMFWVMVVVFMAAETSVAIFVWVATVAIGFLLTSGALQAFGLSAVISPRPSRLVGANGYRLCMCRGDERWIGPGDADTCLGICVQSRYHPCNQK